MKRRANAGFLRSSSLLLGGSLIMAVGKATMIWLLARRFGPEIQGSFSLLLAASTLGGIVYVVGLEYANAYLVGRNPEETSDVIANSLALTAVAFPIILGGSRVAAELFPQVASGFTASAGVWVLAVASALLGLLQMLQAVGLGARLFRLVATANALWGVLGLVAAATLLARGYAAIVIAWLGCTLGIIALLLGALRQTGSRPLRPRGDLLRRQLHFGIRAWPGGLARALNMRLPLYACAFYLTEEQVGVYGVAVACADAFLYVPSALGQATLGLSAARQEHRSGRHTSYVLMACAGMGAALLSWLYGQPVLDAVFGARYAGAALPLTVLFLGATAHAIGLVRLHHLIGSGRPQVATHAQTVALGFVLFGALLFVPRFGLLGAAVTSLITYLAFTIYLFSRAPGHSEAELNRDGPPAD